MSLLTKGVSNFLGLMDAPDSYAGHAQKQARVNLTENALEFVVGSKFTTTKVFDGATASPPTIYLLPYTMIPYYDLGYGQFNRLYGFLAAVHDGYIYVAGGYNGIGTSTNLHFRFNLTTEKWERLANLPGDYRNFSTSYPVSGYHDGKLYYYAPYGPSDWKLLAYDIDGNSWAVYTPPDCPGNPDEAVLFAASDALYLYQTDGTEPAFHTFDRMDYVTHAWTSLNAPPANPCHTGGVIDDELYIVERVGSRRTFKYDKVANSWADQVQNCPTFLGIPAHFIEDQDEIWGATYSLPSSVYKYTPAGGWVQQFTTARNTWPWDWILKPSGMAGWYALHGRSGEGNGTEPVSGGAIQRYIDSGIWNLLKQHFEEGDLLIVNETSGVPVHIEANGALKFIANGLQTVYIIDTTDYVFTLDKDYRYDGLEIWRSVWG